MNIYRNKKVEIVSYITSNHLRDKRAGEKVERKKEIDVMSHVDFFVFLRRFRLQLGKKV